MTSITYQIERWQDCQNELIPLWQAYAAEAKVVIDPDDDSYRWMAENDALVLATMRMDGELVGILRCLIGPDLHHGGTKQAISDGWFVMPEHRCQSTYSGRSAALGLLECMEQELRRHGCSIICQSSSTQRPIDVLLKRHGFDRGETLYRKQL